MVMNDFKLTIGITSFNRYLYLKSLIDSLEEFDRKDYQLIVVDNCSHEKQIRPYLTSIYEQGKIHQLFLRDPAERNWTNDEYIAKNLIIKEARSDVILFLQDDLQFITNELSLNKTIDGFRKISVPCCEINAVRRSTVTNSFAPERQINVNEARFWIPKNNHFHTMGLFKKNVFDIIGEYPVSWPQTQEFWGRSEDWYDRSLKQKYPDAQLNISSWVPHFAPIWNDPRGGYAFIRGNKRYGHYLPPSNNLYYEKISTEKFNQLQEGKLPACFSDVCNSIGWNYAVDAMGDQIKFPQSQVMIDGPETDF